ncbi:MAG: cytochrome b N-terminal domain-containing protein [Alphaproteobacteria bacterium]
MSAPSTYEPKTAFTRWLDKRLPIVRLTHDSFVAYPTPRNLNYWWTFGAVLSLCLVVQIVTGIVLAMHYVPHVDHALASVQRFKREVPFGWLIQPMHAVGASMFFVAVYIHMLRGLYYGSYKAPREVLWILGCVIYLLMVATAFFGYTLPWGQMSFWGATVITNLIGAVPVVGESIHQWLMGGFAIDDPTLNRFFSLHYLLPFVIAGVVVLHIWALHEAGQNNPAGVEPKGKEDTVPFTPHATVKDLVGVTLFLIMFAVFVFFLPEALGSSDNNIPANPAQTPSEITPEWYLRPFYAILRAIDFNVGPIPAKLAGVGLMFGAIAILFVLPWLDSSKVRSMRYRPVARWFFIIFVAAAVTLGWCGSKSPGFAIYTAGAYSADLSWREDGTVTRQSIVVASPDAMVPAMAAADAAARAHGATAVFIQREGGTNADLIAVQGGTEHSQTVTARTSADLDSAISAVKTTVGARAPFVSITRHLPFVFSVTQLAQLLTAYYFAFFLVILPLLGLRETPNRVPDTIAKSIGQGA